MNRQVVKVFESDQSVLGMETGIVSRQEADAWIVKIAWREICAAQAVSCLVEPQVGDKVVLYSDQDASFILHILSRPDETATRTITLGKGATLATAAGEISIMAGKGINAVTPGHVNLMSSQLMITSREADSTVSHWRSHSEIAEIESASFKLKTVSFEMRADRLLQRIKNCFRWIEELDQLKAGQLFYDIKNVLTMRGKHSVIMAEEELKLDGERIHMG
ncbi:MAG: DUF3540 domain-containing protein [Gammaproteobacteria bacterium]